MATTLIFDLGDVLHPIDMLAPMRAFVALSGESVDTIAHRFAQTDLWNALESGKIDEIEFRAGVRSLLGSGASVADEAIDAAFCAVLLGVERERWKRVQALRDSGRYRVLLLSNTNAIHIRCLNAKLAAADLAPIEQLVDRAFLSHELRMRKPDADIFRHVLADQRLEAAATLFFDDNQANVDAAAALGIRAVHVSPSTSVESLLDALLLSDT